MIETADTITENNTIKYFVRIDESYIQTDFKKIESKISGIGNSLYSTLETQGKKSVSVISSSVQTVTKEIASTAKAAQKEMDNTLEKTGSLKDVLSGAGKQAKESLGDALSKSTNGASESVGGLVSSLGGIKGKAGLSASALGGIGAAAADVAIKSIGMATDMSSAMNGFAAKTGTGKGELEQYQGVLENIYKNNYGSSFDEIAEAMAQVKTKFGDISDTDLQSLTESAFALNDVFGYSITDSTGAAKTMMDQFGISSDEAMNLMASGAQNGLDSSGELLNTIGAYSGKFAEMGLGADDMFKMMEAGAANGAASLDGIGNAVGSLADNVLSGSESTMEGFASIGLNADEMSEKFSAGGESAKGAFEETINALASMEDPMAQNQAGVDLFGSAWEDLGPKAIEQMAGIQEGAYDTSDAMNGIKDVNYDDLGSMFEGMSRTLEMLLVPIGEALIPILSTLLEALMPILDVFIQLLEPILQLIGEAIGPLMEILQPLITLIGEGLTYSLQYASDLIRDVFGVCIDYMKDQIEKVKNIFNNIIDFVKNVFTGNWQGAWDNIKNIFSNIWEMIKNAFKFPFNVMIGGINGFIHALNRIKIPDWVPGVGGKGFNIPEIPRLKVGMDYVPGDYFPAFLDKGERVLTAEENIKFTAAGGMRALLNTPSYLSPSLLDTSVITDAVKKGMEQANITVQGDLTAEILADGRKIGDVSTPYVSRNLYHTGNRKARCTT